MKLLYYAQVGNCFLFSNTLNCLRKHPAVTAELNELAIGDFLLFGGNQELSTTTFSDIQRLPPAHKLTVSDGALRTNRYWSLPTDGQIIRYKNDSDYIDRFLELLREAVADRLRTDRIAIFMSGGLDSTTLAATVCELRAREHVDLRTYCNVYDKAPHNERYYSGLVADTLGIPIHYNAIDDYQLFERWEKPQLRRPEPYGWPLLAIHYDSLKTVGEYSRVAFDGEDSDALLFPSTVVEMLKSIPFEEVLANVARYVLSYRKRPLLGLGIYKMVRRLSGRDRRDYRFPTWLNESFAKRLDLHARWKTHIHSRKE